MNKLELIEYVRKNGRKARRNEDGHVIIKNNGLGRQKKGVLYCTIDPSDEDKVIVGFSLCNKLDQFDFINNQYTPGFGLELAQIRAEKWAKYNGYFIQNSWTEEEIKEEVGLYLYENPIPDKDDPNAMRLVEIPPSIYRNVREFIVRCRRFFKDKNFPEWVEKVEKNDYEYHLKQIYLDDEE